MLAGKLIVLHLNRCYAPLENGALVSSVSSVHLDVFDDPRA
jgi:hypothetical protein